MEQLLQTLIRHLVDKGFEITSVPGFIKDVGNFVVAYPDMSLQELNWHLQLSGWDDFELDNYTLQLILTTFDPDRAYEATHGSAKLSTDMVSLKGKTETQALQIGFSKHLRNRI
jgi:hypothetical protein